MSYFETPPGQLVMVDCDDTLVLWTMPDQFNGVVVDVTCRGVTTPKAVNHYNLELVKKLYRTGHAIIVWSGSGVEWAKAVVEALELQDYVHGVIQKPAYYIDDLEDPKKWIGKHAFININGERIA